MRAALVVLLLASCGTRASKGDEQLSLTLHTQCLRPQPPPEVRAHQAAVAADVRHSLGDFKQAIAFMRYSVAMEPGFAERWFMLAMFYRDAGKLRHAAWVMRSFVRYAPTHPRRAEAERLMKEWLESAPVLSAVAGEAEEPPPSVNLTELEAEVP